MTEDLHDLLAVHDLFHKALYLTYGYLLTEEIPGRSAADFTYCQQHNDHSENNHDSQPDTVVQHNAEHCQHHDG